jgi:hypothetical protein
LKIRKLVLTLSWYESKFFAEAAPWLKRLVTGFPPRRPVSGQVEFVVGEVELGQVSPSTLFPLPIHQIPHPQNHPWRVQ